MSTRTIVFLMGAATALWANGATADVFERIKALEGTWYAVGDDGSLTDQVTSTFEITASGTAVREIEFPGAAHEMVTMYRLVDGNVIADHYCMLGNKPTYQVTLTADGSGLSYALINAAEVAVDGAKHMGEGHLTWQDEDRVNTRWLQFEDGKAVNTYQFAMARKPNL